MMKQPTKYQFIGDHLLKMGDENSRLKEYSDAEQDYRNSLKYYKKSKDLIGQGYALSGIGILHEMKGDHPESRIYYEKAVQKFLKADDHQRAGIISELIAHSYETHDALEDALIDYKRSLNSFQKARNSEGEVKIMESISSIEDKRSSVRSTRSQIAFLLFYLALICIAEIVTAYFNTETGLIIHVAVLVMLLVHASIEKSHNFSILLFSMMAVPMIRIIGLTIPVMQVPALYWFPVISIPLFAAVYVIAKTQKISRKNLGLTLGNIPLQLIIGVSGIFLGFIEYMILQPKPLIPSFNPESLLIGGIIILISTGLAEELLFRGIIQKNIENSLGTLFGLLYSALLFTSMHIGWNSIPDLVFVFGVAMFYGYMFQKTRSLFGVTLSHGISNSMLFLVMPFIIF